MTRLDCWGLKATDPNGLLGKYYIVVGSDVNTMIKIFFNAGKFPNTLNQIDIALIPQTRTQPLPDHFKPIRLFCV